MWCFCVHQVVTPLLCDPSCLPQPPLGKLFSPRCPMRLAVCSVPVVSARTERLVLTISYRQRDPEAAPQKSMTTRMGWVLTHVLELGENGHHCAPSAPTTLSLLSSTTAYISPPAFLAFESSTLAPEMLPCATHDQMHDHSELSDPHSKNASLGLDEFRSNARASCLYLYKTRPYHKVDVSIASHLNPVVAL